VAVALMLFFSSHLLIVHNNSCLLLFNFYSNQRNQLDAAGLTRHGFIFYTRQVIVTERSRYGRCSVQWV